MNRPRTKKSDVYLVERLVAKRTRSNRVEYLVKWKNWSEAHNTWEPEKHILDKRLIDLFNKREKRRKLNESDASIDTSQSSLDVSTSSSLSPVPETTKRPTVIVNTVPVPSKSGAENKVRLSPVKPLNLRGSSPQHSVCSPAPSPTVSAVEQDSKLLTIPNSVSSSVTGDSTASTLPLVNSRRPDIDMSPPAQGSVFAESFIDRPTDRRFRQSTMIAAAASASLASFRRNVKQTTCTTTASHPLVSSSLTSRSSTTETNSCLTRSLSEPDESIDQRPKLRITIPREFLFSCTATKVSSNSTSTLSRDCNKHQNVFAEGPSSGSSDRLDESDISMSEVPARFLTPVELPRRSALSGNNHSPTVNLRISEPSILSEIANVDTPSVNSCRSPTKCKTFMKDIGSTNTVVLPKLILATDHITSNPHHKRRSSDEVNHVRLVDPENVSRNAQPEEFPTSKRRKHSDKKEKRRRKRFHDAVAVFRYDTQSTSLEIPSNGFPCPGKIRRRSGSSNSHSSTVSSSEGLSPTPTSNEETPRVAPLRIHLRSLPASIPGTGTNQFTVFSESGLNRLATSVCPSIRSSFASPATCSSEHYNRLRDRSNRCVVLNPRLTLLDPDPRRLRLVQDICVTDVTVDGLTISIKECSRPDDFFGVPSSQLVEWKLDQTAAQVPSTKPSATLATASTMPELGNPAIKTEYISEVTDSGQTFRDENVAPTETDARDRKSCTINPARDLSTIYEESTVESQSSKISEVVPESATELPVKTVDRADEAETDSESHVDNILTSTKSETPSTSALLLAASEACLKEAEEQPSSPGLLTPPRRSSTPVGMSVRPDLVEPLPVSICSREDDVTTSDICIPSVSKSVTSSHITSTKACTKSVSVMFTSRNVGLNPSKSTVLANSVSTKPCHGTSSRPRSKGTASSRSSTPSIEMRRSKTRDCSSLGSSSIKGSRIRSNSNSTRGNTSKILDPAGVYTFPDSSPTHNFCLRTPPVARSSASITSVRRSALSSGKYSDLPNSLDKVGDCLISSGIPSPDVNSFTPLLGLPPSGLTSMTSLSINGPQNLQLRSLENHTHVVSTADSALATAIYLQHLRMQLMNPDASMNPAISPGLPSVPSHPPVGAWTSMQLSNSLSTALGSLLPITSNLVNNETVFNSFVPFHRLTSSCPASSNLPLPPALSPVPSISTSLLPNGSTGPNLLLPAQLQLADMVAAAVSQSAVFNTSSSREVYPSTSHHCGTIDFLPSNDIVPDEYPIDLSAKR